MMEVPGRLLPGTFGGYGRVPERDGPARDKEHSGDPVPLGDDKGGHRP
jgi:hypothetical protein